MKRTVKFLVYIFIVATLTSCIGGAMQQSINQPEFVIQVPSSLDETKYVWSLIKNIQFYHNNGYKLSMPNDEIVNTLIQKNKTNKLSNKDWEIFKSVFLERIYNKSYYSVSYEIVKSNLLSANKAIELFRGYQNKWNFYIPRKYTIVLTLYGPGGSYNPNSGKIFLMTTKYGNFKRSKNPLETIFHEAVHIGIENVVIKKYKVSHWMKERIVDKFVAHHFMNICPDYRLQPNTDTTIDKILNDPKVWDNLPDEISRFLSNKA